MAKTAANIKPFDPADETWEVFMARFDCFLGANDGRGLPDDRKRDLFLHHCGKVVFRTALTLMAPTPMDQVAWGTLKNALRAHYAPAPSKYAKRFEFRQRVQKEGESINAFVAALREAALQGEYGGGLDEALLEQFLCGIRDVGLRQKLLRRHDLTWEAAVSEASGYEISNKAAAYIQNPKTPAGSGAIGIHQNRVRDGSPDTTPSDLSGEEEDEPEVHQTSQQHKPRKGDCGSCGGDHPRRECRFRDAECRRCGKRGHIARVCRSGTQVQNSRHEARKDGRRPGPPPRARADKDGRREKGANLNSVTIDRIGNPSNANKKHTAVSIEGTTIRMEVDTGSPITVVSWETIKKAMPQLRRSQLKRQVVSIKDFQGNRVPVEGRIPVNVEYGDIRKKLIVTVLGHQLPSLLGWDWIKPLGIGLYGLRESPHEIHTTRTSSGADPSDLLREFQDVFDGTLGKYVGTPISFNLDPGIAPIRLKSRRVPFALKPKIEAELEKLVRQGVLVPTDHARWETPIVTPVKADGSVRICADYKATLNKAMQKSAYPVPIVQHLLHSLGPGEVFAKLDLAQAYQQLPVDDTTAEAQTIVTHKGAFKCTRLQFGVSVAPGLFQNLMERLLQGIPGVVPYFDDVLISAATPNQLTDRLREVLTVFRAAGLKLKKEKCQIGVPSVEFLGYRIDREGIHPTESKIKAIQGAPTPKDKTELQAFLGLLNFYSMFLRQKATVAEPLHKLLGNKQPWVWGEREEAAFKGVKRLLTSDSLLIQYNQTLPLVLVCDASPFGVGAVLSHRLPDGREAPIAYFSRTLSAPERNYSQLDKEALAAVAGVKKFHEYLYGRNFELVTDHRPLLGLLAGDRPTPPALSPRLTRWAIFLAAYNYKLVHRAGKELTHADALSRCPLPNWVEDPTPGLPTILIDCMTTSTPLTSGKIAKASRRDTSLRTVMGWVQRGWPSKETDIPPTLAEFGRRRDELTTQGGCLLRGDRVVVPEKLRESVLELLHEGHPGIVRMKGLARSYVWWPGLDKDVEGWVAKCHPCQESRPSPPESPVREWDKPKGPWSRIHIDFAGPFHGQQFLIVVDAFSKWLEVVLMPTITTEALIKVLRRLFSTHGLPDVLVSDNGPQLTSVPFETFLADQGIRHALSAPYKPSTNGLAERFVRATKEALARLDRGDWQHRIDIFLAAQHTTPCPTTGLSPAELLMGRKLRCPLDRIHPNYSPDSYTGATGLREFMPGDKVFIRNYGGQEPWGEGEVLERTAPKSYKILTDKGKTERRHIDQIRKRTSAQAQGMSQGEQLRQDEHETNYQPIPPTAKLGQKETEDLSEQSEVQRCPREPDDIPIEETAGNPTKKSAGNPEPRPPPEEGPERKENTSAQHASPAKTELRRSSRLREKPAYLRDYVC